jgi:hypothetical protein
MSGSTQEGRERTVRCGKCIECKTTCEECGGCKKLGKSKRCEKKPVCEAPKAYRISSESQKRKVNAEKISEGKKVREAWR